MKHVGPFSMTQHYCVWIGVLAVRYALKGEAEINYTFSVLTFITGCHRITKKSDIYAELADIGNWEALCSYLGVPEAKIDELVHEHLENTVKKQRCLAAYVDQGNACWEEVIKVVAGYPFYKKLLAEQIAAKHCVAEQR